MSVRAHAAAAATSPIGPRSRARAQDRKGPATYAACQCMTLMTPGPRGLEDLLACQVELPRSPTCSEHVALGQHAQADRRPVQGVGKHRSQHLLPPDSLRLLLEVSGRRDLPIGTDRR
jgi:hypothetical protein